MVCVGNEGDAVVVDSGQVMDWGCGTDGRTSGRVSRECVEV